MQTILLAILTAVVIEFGLHVIIHALTGRGGLNEPAFAVYGELFREWKERAKLRREAARAAEEAERNNLYHPAAKRGDAA